VIVTSAALAATPLRAAATLARRVLPRILESVG